MIFLLFHSKLKSNLKSKLKDGWWAELIAQVISVFKESTIQSSTCRIPARRVHWQLSRSGWSSKVRCPGRKLALFPAWITGARDGVCSSAVVWCTRQCVSCVVPGLGCLLSEGWLCSASSRELFCTQGTVLRCLYVCTCVCFGQTAEWLCFTQVFVPTWTCLLSWWLLLWKMSLEQGRGKLQRRFREGIIFFFVISGKKTLQWSSTNHWYCDLAVFHFFTSLKGKVPLLNLIMKPL